MRLRFRLVVTFMGLSLLAACGGAGAVGPPLTAAGAQPAVQSPAEKLSGALLYVSDTITNDVYVYSYPKAKLLQTLTYFSEPAGECVDASGNVFVTNTGASNVLEFKHGGRNPIATLDDSGFFPIGCAVSPTSGDLAVTNFGSVSSTPGNVMVYKGATGQGKAYSNKRIAEAVMCAYDGAGNLFLDGLNSGSGFEFAELPAGGSRLKRVTLNQSIGNAGGVAWDGTYVAVGDQSKNTVYEFSISGLKGTEAGSTQLGGATQVFQFWIDGSRVIGADAYGGDVGIWKYPQGGAALKIIGGLNAPLGVTVSPGK